jgi:membrane protease YdiL (CAAX protease family)
MIHVRTEPDGPSRAYEVRDLADGAGARVGADTEIALSADGPFEKAAVAALRDGRLRDALAAGLPAGPSLRGWARTRIAILALGVAPALMLLELDRELVSGGAGSAGSPARLAMDAALVAWIVYELTRKTPRVLAAATVALASFALRWALVAARLCGVGLHPALWAAIALAFGAAGLALARGPSRRRVVLELLDRLGIPRLEALSAQLPPIAPGALVAAASVAAAGLPLALLAMRHAGRGVGAETAVFVAYGAIVPAVVTRRFDPARGARRADREGLTAGRIALAFAAGLVLAAALAGAAHAFFDTGAELARCTGRLDAETRRLLAREAEEIRRSVEAARASGWLVATTVLVVPIVEERVYRGLLMDVLVRKYGAAYGLFASAVVFGVAHTGSYDVALYQTVLLGVAFGVAYAEGGIVAAIAAHAAWNVTRLI